MARKLWAQGLALSRELAELIYDVDYYVHIDTKEDAVKLVTHMPYRHLRRNAERCEGPDQAEGRADARADLTARVRLVGDRRRALLRRHENGRARPGLGPEYGGRPAVQHRDYRRHNEPACRGAEVPGPVSLPHAPAGAHARYAGAWPAWAAAQPTGR